MGQCTSVMMDDEDKILHLRNKQMKRELQEFQKQMRKQRAFSELDLTGRPKIKKQPLTAEQAAAAMSVIYDA